MTEQKCMLHVERGSGLVHIMCITVLSALAQANIELSFQANRKFLVFCPIGLAELFILRIVSRHLDLDSTICHGFSDLRLLFKHAKMSNSPIAYWPSSLVLKS
jgi:hypothetical protein